jgi:hypothetical protein
MENKTKIIIGIVVFIILIILGILFSINFGSVTQMINGNNDDNCELLEYEGQTFNTISQVRQFMETEFFQLDVDEVMELYDLKIINGMVYYCDTLDVWGESNE